MDDDTERDPAGRELADPEEHPEQHAALQAGGQREKHPQDGTDDERIDTEQHSESEGPFGTG